MEKQKRDYFTTYKCRQSGCNRTHRTLLLSDKVRLLGLNDWDHSAKTDCVNVALTDLYFGGVLQWLSAIQNMHDSEDLDKLLTETVQDVDKDINKQTLHFPTGAFTDPMQLKPLVKTTSMYNIFSGKMFQRNHPFTLNENADLFPDEELEEADEESDDESDEDEEDMLDNGDEFLINMATLINADGTNG